MGVGSVSVTHVCPCGCGANVARRQLACREGWRRLPGELKTAIRESYRKGAAGAREHRVAVVEAFEWYRKNPRPAA